MTDDPTVHALDVVARYIAAEKIHEAVTAGGLPEEWALIHGLDMIAVEHRLVAERDRLDPGHAAMYAAYEHLANRAKGDTDE